MAADLQVEISLLVFVRTERERAKAISIIYRVAHLVVHWWFKRVRVDNAVVLAVSEEVSLKLLVLLTIGS